MKWANIAVLVAIGVSAIMLVADLQRSGHWFWKKVPRIGKYITPTRHRALLVLSMGGIGLSCIFMVLAAYTVDFRTEPVDLLLRMPLAIALAVAASVHPFAAALESPAPKGGMGS